MHLMYDIIYQNDSQITPESIEPYFRKDAKDYGYEGFSHVKCQKNTELRIFQLSTN